MKYNMSVKDMDKDTRKIYDELVRGDDKKVIANRNKVSLDVVMTIAKRHNTGQKVDKTNQKALNNDNDQVQNIVVPTSGVSKTLSTEISSKVSSKGDGMLGLSDDTILKILEDLDGKILSYEKICDQYSISKSSLYEIIKEYGDGIIRKSRSKNGGNICGLSDEQIADLMNDIETSNLTNKKIAEKYNISIASFYKIKKQYKQQNEARATQKEEPMKEVETKKNDVQQPKSNIIDISDDDLTLVYYRDDIVECELVKDRHETPCDLCIFHSNPIPENLLFNYDRQEAIVREFIENNFHNNSNRHLILYVSGIQCALAAVIKVCSEMNVDLTLMHYHAKSNKYRAQVIWDNLSDQSVHILFKNNFMKFNNIYTYKCSVDDIMKSDSFYAITQISHDDPKNKICNIILSVNQIDIFEIYYKFAHDMMTIDGKRILYLNENKLSSTGTMIRKREIIKTSNF